MKHLFFAIIFLISILFSHVFGQEVETEKKDTTTLTGRIEEVTVTAFRAPYNIFNIPAPVHLISALQLETGNSLTPAEVLNQVPGLYMHNGTINTNRLTIRGIGSRTPYATNKIKAYFGEIPLTTGDGETTLEDLENAAIKRVEIIKGPSSSLYGAGLAGVILFHLKNVEKDYIQNRATIASFGTIKNVITAGVKNKNSDIFALGSVLNSNGFRENNNTSRYTALINSTYSFTSRTNLQVLLRGTKMNASIPSSLDFFTFQNNPEKAAENWKSIGGYEDYLKGQFGVSFQHITKNNEKISAATFGSFKNLDELRPFNRLDESSNYIGWRAYIQKSIEKKNLRFVFTTGLEFFREKFLWKTLSNENGDPISDNIEKRQYENLFFQMESSFSEIFFLSAGMNGNLTRFRYYDRFFENGDQSGNHSYKPVISPRVGFNLLPAENFSFYGNVSHGFSTPSFEETLLPEGELNTEIKPELGWNAEMGIRSQFSDRFLFSASYYRIYVSNLLVARRTGEDAYVGVNAGKSLHPGFEAEFTWNVLNPERFPALALTGNATISNYHFVEFVDDGMDYSGNLLPGTAKNTFLAAVTLNPAKNLSLNSWYRFTGKMPVNDSNSDFTKEYGTANAVVKYSIGLNKFKAEIKTGVQNIFDTRYAAMIAVNAPAFGGRAPRYYYPGNPRNYFLSLLLSIE